jgi:hypothetical protein
MRRSRRALIASTSVVAVLAIAGIVNGCATITCDETATCPIVTDDGFVPDTGDIPMNDVGAPSIDGSLATDSAPATDPITANDSPSAIEGASPMDSALPMDGPPVMDSPPPIDSGGGRCPTNATLPYPVDGNGSTQPAFISSGYEGDTCAITMLGTAGACAGHTIAGAVGKCWSVTIKRPPAPCTVAAPLSGWAGVEWQYPVNNWTDPSIMGGLNMCGATKVTFWAAAVAGTQTVSFFAGNKIAGYSAQLPNQVLSTTWLQFTMPFVGVPDTNASIGFGWSTNLPAAGGSVTFMIDNIQWQ